MGDRSNGALELLRTALESRNQQIAAALKEAEKEYAAYQRYCAELDELIGQARIVLNLPHSQHQRQDLRTVGQVTLHQEIADIMAEHGNKGMRARDIVFAVNQRGRYSKRDGSPVEINQIHARVHNNPHLFRKEDFKIYLREVS